MPRLHRELMRELLGQIVAGDHEAGAMLPKEQDLADAWGTSRGVVRETIRALEERGVLTVKHGRGATVVSPEGWNVLDPEVLRAVLDGDDAVALVRELLEVRRTLAAEVATLAAERRTDEQLAAMQDAIAEMRAAANSAGHRRAEARFQRQLAAAAANRPLAKVLAPLNDAVDAAVDRVQDRHETVAYHERLLAAVRAGDGVGAAAAAVAHVDALLAPRGGRRRASAR